MSGKARHLILLGVILGVLTAGAARVSGASAINAKYINYFTHIRAEHNELSEKLYVYEGRVHLPMRGTPYGDFDIYADKVIIDPASLDMEAIGNVRLYRLRHVSSTVTPSELAHLESQPNTAVTITGITGDVWGEQRVSISADIVGDSMEAARLSGNLNTGFFSFEDANLRFNNFVCRADYGTRRPNGVITVRKAEFSGCEYLTSNNAHYSFGCLDATITPHETEFYELQKKELDTSEYTVLCSNGFVKIYGIPCLWLPFIFKPREETLGLSSVQFGKENDWGYYLKLSKRIRLTDYPMTWVNLIADFYEDRGYAYGMDAIFATEHSKTSFFGYCLWDLDPNMTNDYSKYRVQAEKYRYVFNVNNLTHITPRLDFRAQFEIISDPYFRKDFMYNTYGSDPEQSTYIALEQQFDDVSASLLTRFKVNKFFTTSERLPALTLTLPRIEILDTNLYYQSDFSAGYYKMNWIEFDDPPKNPLASELKNYEAFRLDTTHFVYYPIRLDWLTLIPRAGFKITAYSNSSEKDVSEADLMNMFKAADLYNTDGAIFRNYDKDGGSKFRFAGEIGVEASTKFYNAWQNVRSVWFKLDGLRHVMRPYVNYTFLPNPTQDRDNLYYFDDIDRLEEQHFVRFGLENRVQTRDGSGSRTIFQMENYWDLHMKDQDNLSQIGDFCTKISTEIFKGLTLSTTISIDVGNNNKEQPDVYRNGRDVGHPGLVKVKWINKWNLSLTYSPVQDVRFSLTYNYIRPYSSRSAYSMGSSMSRVINAGRCFDNIYTDQTEQLTFGMQLPLTPDRRTLGTFSFDYDFNEGRVNNYTFGIIRKFHCVDLIFSYQLQYNDEDGDNMYENNFSFTIRLTSLQAPIQAAGANQMLNTANTQLNTAMQPGNSLL